MGLALLVSLCLCAAAALPAGDLIPPGTPAPTAPSLANIAASLETAQAVEGIPFRPDGVSPFTIDRPGRWVLTGDVTVTTADPCITVTSMAQGAIIDLNGHTISGGAGGIEGNPFGVTVTNGKLESIASPLSLGGRTRLVDLQVVASGSVLVGRGSIVRGLHVFDSSSNGLSADEGCVIVNSTFEGCALSGLITDSNSTLRGVTARGNQNSGIVVGDGSTAVDCASVMNGVGFSGAMACTFLNCTALDNGNSGFILEGGSVMRGCSARRNLNGVARRISTPMQALIQECVFSDNLRNGALILDESVVRDCLFSGNGADPDRTDAAILVGADGSQIRDNSVLNNDQGIQVLGERNFIARNTVSNSGSNYDIGANNSFGPIVDVTASGDIAGVSGNTHPWVNFVH